MFLIPALPAGTYWRAVRAAIHGGARLETGFPSDALTVADAVPSSCIVPSFVLSW
jgi:hypothetical protein